MDQTPDPMEINSHADCRPLKVTDKKPWSVKAIQSSSTRCRSLPADWYVISELVKIICSAAAGTRDAAIDTSVTVRAPFSL